MNVLQEYQRQFSKKLIIIDSWFEWYLTDNEFPQDRWDVLKEIYVWIFIYDQWAIPCYHC